jgi:hypothetical protein
VASALATVQTIRRTLRIARTAGERPEAIAISSELMQALLASPHWHLWSGLERKELFGVLVKYHLSATGWTIRWKT